MTTQIPKENWKEFFDNLSRDLAGWETSVEVISDDVGAQMLTEGLPLAGLTFEEVDEASTIELSFGSGTESHQAHNIFDPVLVAFEGKGPGQKGTLDIEDKAGTKTLVKFLRPFPVLAEYRESEPLAVR